MRRGRAPGERRSRIAIAARSGEGGFTVLELVISVSLVAAVMTIVLTAFDLNSTLSRVQQDVSELQQSVRIAQRDIAHNARMAGRGGLPRPLSIVVTQGVAPGTTIGTGADEETILEGTDVLTIRGTFESPIYKVNGGDEDTFVVDGTTATLLIDDLTTSGFEQSLDRLTDLISGGSVDPEPILLVSRQSDAVYAVVELASLVVAEAQLPYGAVVNRATLTLNINPAEGTHTAQYLALSSGGGFPAALTSVGSASVLEEFRYYIREDYSIPGDDTSPLSPKLARARMIPGTEIVHPDEGSVAIDIADGIFDLQLALGIDLDTDGVIDTLDAGGDPLALDADEWLWNHVDDDEGLGWDAATLRLVRLTFLGQAGRADRQYISPAIASIENREYNEDAVPALGADIVERRYRRRQLQSVVDLRNL